MQINNFLVIRFSLRLKEEWLRKAYGDEENRYGWLEMRGRIFKETLYRSLLEQSVRPKRVFLLLDVRDEEFYHACLNDLDEMIEPIFSKNWNHYEQVADRISASGLTNIAVSRCDSDDLVATDYFEKVNAAIRTATEKGESFEYVVATRGFISDGVNIQETYYSCSPFLTIFEKEWNGANVYGIGHENVVKHSHIAVSDARWMQYIHGTNIANSFSAVDADREAFEAAIRQAPKRTSMKRCPVAEFWPDGFHKVPA
ncbi:glycosyltransferase [Salipiger abyssi]|uniref:Putative rhamnosyl transferase n=1 Tax=Salipiger abyssi TaxID=1250539 RepID=A0A1P8V0N0_9RHOB|nr:glycosyltransferase [Salipiger abyssi]APZ55191.1 Putative rhamnosyl transferase [Salipiger abyssi]